MNYSKKHCKQIAYRLVRARFYPKTSSDAKIVIKAYKNTAYHYSRNKKIYRW